MSRKSYIEKYYNLKPKSKTRIALPFTIKCNFCLSFTFKGTKKNCFKKIIKRKMNVNFYCFFINCWKCHKEMSIMTNPELGKYTKYKGCEEINEEIKTKEEKNNFISNFKVEKTDEEIEKELFESLVIDFEHMKEI